MTKSKGVHSGDYDVGYGKPPVETRFKKGQPSRNPLGRGARKARAPQNPAKLFENIMQEPVMLKMGGKTVAVDMWEAIIRQLRSKALQGDKAAIRQLLSLAKQFGCLDKVEKAMGGLLVLPAPMSLEEFEKAAAAQQAPYRCNVGDWTNPALHDEDKGNI